MYFKGKIRGNSMKIKSTSRAILSTGLILLVSASFSNGFAQTDYFDKYVSTLFRTCVAGDLVSCIEGGSLQGDSRLEMHVLTSFLSQACTSNHSPSCEALEKIAIENQAYDGEVPPLNTDDFKITVSDRDAQPLVRIPPQMPIRFISFTEHSGYCHVKFNVSPSGQPFDVTTTFCTDSSLKRPTIISVQKWKYNPKIVNGKPVARDGVESRITFSVQDERGRILPFPDE